jgi:hypothetical protein
MAHLVSKPVVFDALHLRVLTSVWEYAGDVQVTALKGPLGSDDPYVKNILTKGSVRVEYPGTDSPDVIESAPNCRIFPSSNAVGKTIFRLVVLEDNTQTQCVQPLTGYRIITEKDVALVAGGTLTIPKGVVVLAFGDSYTVNGDVQEGFHTFALQNNDIVVNANATCRFIVFKSIPIET